MYCISDFGEVGRGSLDSQIQHYIFWILIGKSREGLRGGGGVGMGVSGMVFVGLVLGCIEAKFCK